MTSFVTPQARAMEAARGLGGRAESCCEYIETASWSGLRGTVRATISHDAELDMLRRAESETEESWEGVAPAARAADFIAARREEADWGGEMEAK